MTDVLTSIQRILDKPDDEDCDGLLRDALRLSLLQHPDMEEDDQDTLYDCIWTLIGRYIESPEGEGEDAQILMTRLLWVVFPVLKPHAPRGSNERQDETIVTDDKASAGPERQARRGHSRCNLGDVAELHGRASHQDAQQAGSPCRPG